MKTEGGDGRGVERTDNQRDPLLDGDDPVQVAGISAERLRSFVERIERLEEERRGIAADIKEVKAEAKGTGFDVRIINFIIRERRMDKDDLDEQETLRDVYRRALGMTR
jgi:uncharacterized protein (UPF0335 family)